MLIAQKSDLEYLGFIVGPEEYKRWAARYYGKPINSEGVDAIFDFAPLDARLVSAINRDLSIQDLLPDIEEIQYPIGEE